MYDVRQFRPTLYLLLLLGFSGFAIAAESPGLWVLGVAGVLLNAQYFRKGLFRPLPRLVANLITLLAVIYVLWDVRVSGGTPIIVIGQFMVMLQLVKLFEQRANRDYAQLLILSLLLMVAAAINTASLLFGILFIIYLFLSLFCCLLFHLKVESDHARAAIATPTEKLNPAALRHDQRFLSRSMRKLTAVVAGVSIIVAVVVFLFFPRGPGVNLLAPLQPKLEHSLSGFSDTVDFQNIAQIALNNAMVARMRVWHNDKPVDGTQTILLRGTTLNKYQSESWKWTRQFTETVQQVGGLTLQSVGSGDQRANSPNRWKQEIWLSPTGSNVLFAMAGPLEIKTGQPMQANYHPMDEIFLWPDELQREIHYEVVSSNANPNSASTEPMSDSGVTARFEKFAQRPEVSGTNEAGPLAAQRGTSEDATPLDAAIANNICNYLRNNYTYTLDLTDTRNLSENQDPLLAFLTDFKKGHCEYFAGAMTILCQSLGMQARLVVGFKCDEYNTILGANYYIVRQSHAHAWVEVRTPDGWQTFDPTGSAIAEMIQPSGIWQKFKHALDYLEYTWATSVVAYDRSNQENVIRNAESRLTNAGIQTTDAARDVKSWFSQSWKDSLRETIKSAFFVVSSAVLSALIYLMLFALVGAIGGYIWEKWKLRQRARRIGLENLPASAQLRLARQLAFYDDLIKLLERHKITRPRHLTPMEFSSSMTFLPSEAYDAVQRLTGIFYRIRYGRHEISFEQRQRLHRMIHRIEQALTT